MAEHVAWRAPDVTALYETSMRKKWTNGMGGRTCIHHTTQHVTCCNPCRSLAVLCCMLCNPDEQKPSASAIRNAHAQSDRDAQLLCIGLTQTTMTDPVLQASCKQARQAVTAHHVLFAGHKVDTPSTQLGSVIRIMSSPINASIANVVHRCGIGGGTEATPELAAPVYKPHMGVHVSLAVDTPDGPCLPKVNCLHTSKQLRLLLQVQLESKIAVEL